MVDFDYSVDNALRFLGVWYDSIGAYCLRA